MESRVTTRKPKGRRLLQAAVATAVALGAPVALAGTADAATPTAKWDRIAQCESGGKWNTATGNGYYGGLQFSPSTWKAYGGKGSAHKASKSEQIKVAERVLADAGLEGVAGVLEEARLPALIGQRTATSVALNVCRTTSATAWSGPLPASVGAVSTTYTGRSTAT